MVATNDTFSLQFITSYDRENKPFHAYILIPDSMLPMFKRLVTKLSVNLAEFGVIIHKGAGHEPPNAVKQRIKSEFPMAKL